MLLKKTGVLILVLVFCLCFKGFAEEKKEDTLDKEELEKQISYALGYDIFEKLKENFSLDPEFFIQGSKDADQHQSKLSEEKLKELLMSYQRIIRHRQIEKMKLESEENRKKGADFLEANKKKEGVITLASGLQYKILKDGKGPVPKAADTVECNYIGTLIDDTVFDSSYDRGKPAVFQVGLVIQGWIEALQIMKTGSVWMLYVPTSGLWGQGGRGHDQTRSHPGI